MVQLEFHDKKVEKIMLDPKKVVKTIGLEMAKILKRRLNELQSSANFKEYLDFAPGKPHPLSNNLDKLFGISLNKNYRLIVEPLTDSLDNLSLKNCKKINIKGVADYHDGKCEWIIP